MKASNKQVFKLKLGKGHTAAPNQITKDGYLADDDGQPFIYNQSAAKDKANLFNGTPEKFGKSYLISTPKMLQVDKDKLNPFTVELLRMKAYYENKAVDSFMCFASVFDDLLEYSGLKPEVITELQVFSVFCVEADYIQFL